MALFGKLRWISRRFTTLAATPLRICVVGSGPAGFYTAEKILKAHKEVEVDIVDRLPTPFGLVRSGVAPDHPETKIVINQFSRVAQNDRCSFLGNVSVGSSVSLPELHEMYNAVVLAYGAESDRTLGIPGEELGGIHAAREFVWWYNGHPDCRNLAPDLTSTDTAVILGQGNVALDVARILLRPTMELAKTDIASHALAALEESSIRKVYLIGRRGPVQAACTAKELREVLGIKDISIQVKQADLVTTPADEVVMKNNRIRRRVYDLILKAASSGHSPPLPDQRELHLVFFRKPDRFLESKDRSGHVAGVLLEETTLQGDDLGKQIAVGNGVFEEISCGLVLKSIGFKSVAIDGLPFDHDKGIVPNVGGRVLADSSTDFPQYETGLYVCGWLKRGPTGIIGTNLYCAEETVASLSEDIERGVLTSNSAKPGRGGLLQLLDRRNIRVLQFHDWERIDTEEKRGGNLKNKPREKLATWEELLQVASK
ncbi:NADPH:adrenodoxin oxidoreductase, mitochondrial-like isoform X1 [Olea europaea var. sylvestris]|uniref:NADPH:adrenodoxin oxidoreductase, mitochondrial n=1 Tax=Olea europaea subsp. europaea TaxID=158383 RepID=A0A8S0PRG9_OLEEU|nr:NADPH:adrenodoxin oxidoreductase, mitochondrial-like isoform X1 [Olea europaea var. sylvestris]XP_022881765.1 NADPH:adrenodoxin oxidoreductase, mitochondrial-like isoform X1 [Olea europaea var. sylvestris]XP_022881771.1 NADPH:adrenodoxin oxidoreductase, mitochondrial-like isoform X1 [Olea europaea var. sylvestris]CAA2956927.1 NADPH:adrenodoxin oxidoreductase, mitochondrial-like [Olea europaea subsp. europaea]